MVVLRGRWVALRCSAQLRARWRPECPAAADLWQADLCRFVFVRPSVRPPVVKRSYARCQYSALLQSAPLLLVVVIMVMEGTHPRGVRQCSEIQFKSPPCPRARSDLLRRRPSAKVATTPPLLRWPFSGMHPLTEEESRELEEERRRRER